MAKNRDLNNAKLAKKDEFYTSREDIEDELPHYSEFFQGKTVYMNCDDPVESEFWQFFVRNFSPWKIKKLIATHYEPNDKNYAYKLELSEDTDGNGVVNWNDEPTITQIPCNGDFRSAYCIGLLKESDIVVTNPPWSLTREYIAQLIEYDKKFVVMAHMNALKYKEIFPYIKENKLWSGYNFNKTMIFKTPYKNTDERNRKYVLSKGYDPDEGWIKVPGVIWITNLDIKKRHNFLDLRGNYYKKNLYPKYDNLDAIDVEKYADIPIDYEGLIGVPISFIGDFNSDQFEIVGMGTGDTAKEIGVTKNYRGRTDLSITKNGKTSCPYTRIIIKHKHPAERKYPDED